MAAELALLIPIVAILMVFGTPVFIVAMTVFGTRQRSYSDTVGRILMAELQNMRQLNASQSETIRQLQQRLENVESVLAGAEYPAQQRIAGAMTAPASVASTPADEPQAITRS